MNENHPVRFEITMAGIPGKGGVKGRSGPPGNMNAFKHGLPAIEKRREESITTMRRGKACKLYFSLGIVLGTGISPL
jgi:hypothetical protein